MSKTTKVVTEPFSLTDFTERIMLDKDFQILAFKWSIGIISAFVLLVVVSFILFCHLSYKPTPVYIQNAQRELFYDK